MLNFLPSTVLYVINSILLVINTFVCSSLVCVGGVIKFLLPISLVQRNFTTPLMNSFMWLWATGNGNILKLTSNVEWDVEGLEQLNKNNWYLVISNHVSGLDIAVQSYLLRNHIPMLKFFLKKELMYVPFMGAACWALGMPFMDRTSPKKLRKNPKLKGKDLKTTQKACEKFRKTPTSIINYVEGSRLTEAKRLRQNSPYRYLLKPKAGGIALALSAMGDQFSQILNITLVYPHAPKYILDGAMKGRITKIVMRIDAMDVRHVDNKQYFENIEYRVAFQRWLNQLWQQKDEQIHQILLESQTENSAYQESNFNVRRSD